MKKLSLNEGIGVAVALVVTFGILFFGNSIFGVLSGKANTQGAAVASTKDLNGAIKVEDISIGTGRTVKTGDIVAVNYIGSLADGKTFDSSYDRKQPINFTVGAGQLIKGFDQGVVGMKEKGKRRITIPPELGYGAQQVGPIPANSVLVFDVELIEIK